MCGWWLETHAWGVKMGAGRCWWVGMGVGGRTGVLVYTFRVITMKIKDETHIQLLIRAFREWWWVEAGVGGSL